MKNFSRFVSALCGTMLCVGMAHAQTTPPTLTINDAGEPHAPITYLQSFSTSLTATVNPQDIPIANEEVEVDGPYYQWSGGGSGLKLSSTSSKTVILASTTPPDYYGADYKSVEGDQTVTVNCTVTYLRRNKDTQESLPALKIPGTKQVKFLIRVPKKVVWDGDIAPEVINGPYGLKFPSPWKAAGIDVFTPQGQARNKTWGVGDRYYMRLEDQAGELYEFGSVKEAFENVQNTLGTFEDPNANNEPNGVAGPSTWAAPEFEDVIQKARFFDPGLPTGTIWRSFLQPFSSVEGSNKPRTLNSHFITVFIDSTSRAQ